MILTKERFKSGDYGMGDLAETVGTQFAQITHLQAQVEAARKTLKWAEEALVRNNDTYSANAIKQALEAMEGGE